MIVLPPRIGEGAEILQTKKVTLDRPIVVVGFPGPGLVGTIVVDHLIRMLNMDLIGTIRSVFTPPVAPFYGGVLRAPIRIHSSTDGKLVAVISEVALPNVSLPYFAYAISEWAQKNNAAELICIEGIAKEGEAKKIIVYGAAEPEVLSELKEHKIATLPVGFIGGLPGAIMNECLMRELNGLCLLVEAAKEVPDPEAAAEVSSALGRIRGISIDVQPLLSQAKIIKRQMQDLAEQTEKAKQHDLKNSPVPIYM